MSSSWPHPLEATVVIGRFQPLHKGHEALIRYAMSLGPKTFIILGSHNHTRTFRNVWTSEERKEMIQAVFSPEEMGHLHVVAMEDNPDHDLWIRNIYAVVTPFASKGVGLVGHRRDGTSYYMDLFKEWTFVEAPEFEGGISGTTIREAYFRRGQISESVSGGTQKFLRRFQNTPPFERFKKEYEGGEHDTITLGV